MEQRIIWPEDRYVIAGSVGHVYIRCSFDSDWDGLSKRLVFSNGDIIRSVLITSDTPIAVPHEVLTAGKLSISVVGVSENGEKKLTTRKMALPVTVLEAGAQDGDEPDSLTPELWEQALAAIGDLSDLNTRDKRNLVAAVNEAAVSGAGGSGGAGIESIAYKCTDTDGGNVYTVTLTDSTSYEFTAPKGAAGSKGDKGSDGEDGTGISSVAFKTTNSAGGNVYTITLSDGSTYDFTAPKGNNGAAGAAKTISGLTIEARTSDGGLFGDINGDGAVNTSDAEALLQAIADGDTLDVDTMDFNGDGVVNNADSLALSSLVAGLEDGQTIAKIKINYTDSTSSVFYGYVTDYYTKSEIDSIMGSYITELDTLIGGNS